VFSTLLLHKIHGKVTDSFSAKEMGIGNRVLCFHTHYLPCCCSYWNWHAAVMRCVCPAGQANWANFNLDVGYQEPGSHKCMNFRASSVLTQLASAKGNANTCGLLLMQEAN